MKGVEDKNVISLNESNLIRLGKATIDLLQKDKYEPIQNKN
jgi:hypothetical protein